MTKKMQLYRIIYCSLTALHVSSEIFVIIRSVTTVFAASGIIHICGCRLESCCSWCTEP